MKGEVIRMGTMEVDGETLTGVFVECERDEFTSETGKLLYVDVEIKREDEG